MKRIAPLFVLTFLLATTQTASSQSFADYLQGEFIVKGGMSYFSFFDAFSNGAGMVYIGAEKVLGDQSRFTATADMQFATFGGGGFFYMGAAGGRYYFGQALSGLNAGVWALYQSGSLGAGLKAGYQIPMGRMFIDLSGGPAYLAGSGGGGMFFLGTGSVGFKFGG